MFVTKKNKKREHRNQISLDNDIDHQLCNKYQRNNEMRVIIQLTDQ